MSSNFETCTVIVPNNPNLAATLKDDPSNGNRNAYCLGRTNGLKLKLGGSDHNVITELNFYPSRADESNGTNAATLVISSDGTHAATISGVRVDGHTVPLLVAIAWDSDRQWVQIANIEGNSPMQPDCVWFTLTIAHNRNDHHWTFTLDPELVNTGGNGGWTPTSPSDPVQTLSRVALG